MSDDHLPNLPPEAALELAEIDLAIEEILRSLDECLSDLDLEPVDRSLLIHHCRWAYIEGWMQRHQSMLGHDLTPDSE